MRNTSCSFGVSALRRNIQRCGMKLRVTALSGLYRRMFMNVKGYRHGTGKATSKCGRDLWTILKLDESPFQNPKSEISKWTALAAPSSVDDRFRSYSRPISKFLFELFLPAILWVIRIGSAEEEPLTVLEG